MKYFDTHAHYYDLRFERECEIGVESLLNTLFSGRVSNIINVATSPENARLAIEQAKRFSGMYTAIGIHPSDAQELKIPLSEALFEIEKLITDKENKCVALGEIGLDYHYENTDKKLQNEYLEEQLCLAERLDVPVVIHDREAHGDIMDAVRRHPNVRGVFHSYSGSLEMARELIKRGYMLSFSGTVTFKNAQKVRDVVKGVDKTRIMIETDAPYLAPTPHRGKINHSGYLEYTCRAVSEILEMREDETAQLTAENAKKIFQLPR